MLERREWNHSVYASRPLVQQGTLLHPGVVRLPAQARARAHRRRADTVVASDDAPRPPTPAAARSG